jgi:hypothetical protein
MNPTENASSLLQQWLEMTRAEAEAIQSSAWQRIAEIQSRKASLRQPLTEAFQHWNPGELPFRADLGRLIALESRNAQALTDRLQKAREQHLALEPPGIPILDAGYRDGIAAAFGNRSAARASARSLAYSSPCPAWGKHPMASAGDPDIVLAGRTR